MSRTGNAKELLRGPLAYGIVLTFATYYYWRQLTAVRSIIFNTTILPLTAPSPSIPLL